LNFRAVIINITCYIIESGPHIYEINSTVMSLKNRQLRCNSTVNKCNSSELKVVHGGY